MSKFRAALVAFMTAVSVVSCAKYEDAPQKESPIEVSAGVELTRAGYSGVEVLPEMFVMDILQNDDQKYDYKNVWMVKNDGLITYSPESGKRMLWAGTSYGNVKVKAMTLPYEDRFDANYYFYASVSRDQSTDSEVLASDLLVATTEAGDIAINDGRIRINFKHLFSKLEIKYVLGGGLKEEDVTIYSATMKDICVGGYYTYKDMAFRNDLLTSNDDVIMYHNAADKQYEVLFYPYVPQSNPILNIHAKVLGIERVLTCAIVPGAAGFESGKRYTLKVTVTSGAVTPAGTTIASGWAPVVNENTFVTE